MQRDARGAALWLFQALLSAPWFLPLSVMRQAHNAFSPRPPKNMRPVPDQQRGAADGENHECHEKPRNCAANSKAQSKSCGDYDSDVGEQAADFV